MKIGIPKSDPYDRKARLYPGLLLLSPVIVTMVSTISAGLTVIQQVSTFFIALGGGFLLTQLARDSGKKNEKSLFQKWGGMPSVSIFRHRDQRIDTITKLRYHNILAALVKGTTAPSVDTEIASPDTADLIYLAWSNYIRVNTRDTKRFSLLFKDLVNYGYRRNVWGLKRFGIVVSVLIISGYVGCYFYINKTIKVPDIAMIIPVVFSFIMLILWIFRFTPDWVKLSADAYALSLVECAEPLGGSATSKKPKAKKEKL